MGVYLTSIHQKVAEARAGTYPFAICKLASGWVMVSESQPVEGYCLLFSDPVVKDLNSLDDVARAQYCLDMIRVGDALLKIKGAARINYETWGNLDSALHTHIVPRYANEPADKRVLPVCKGYDAKTARRFDPQAERGFIEAMREYLARRV